MQLAVKTKNNNKTFTDVLFIMLIFAAALRFAVGVGYYNPQDTLWYKEWVLGLNNGLFDIYSRAETISLDYPPIYLFFLRITGFAYQAFGADVHGYTDMFLMKFWPIVGDVICGLALYFVFKSKSPKTGLVAAALWLFNPTTVFNSSFWGQTDSIMCLMLLISFVALENNKPLLACFLFALSGMTKFQCLFFTPVFLIELFVRFRFSSFLKGITVAAATVVAVFAPFMVGSSNPMLFFDVYLKGQGQYPYCTLNAYNVYGIFGLNWVEDSNGIISLYTLSFVLVAVLIVGLIATYVFAKRRSVWVIGYLFMNTLFMFMTRMHERYQFVVLIFILMATLIHKKRSFLYIFIGTSLITLINQLIPMFAWQTDNSVFDLYYGQLMQVFSSLNLVLYIVGVVVCLKYLFEAVPTIKITEEGDVQL